MKRLSYHLAAALLLADMVGLAYAEQFQPVQPNFAQQAQQAAETVSRIRFANQRALLLQQQAALSKQQRELEQQNRRAEAERAQAERDRAHHQAEQDQAQKAEQKAELQSSQNDQHEAALAGELLIAALQRQREELIHQRSAATDLSAQENLDAQVRRISQELQTVQSR